MAKLRKQIEPEAVADQESNGSKVDYAYRRLEEMIVTRELPPGSLVSEVQLAQELELGRTPVREALARLKHFGFVETHPRRGTLVAGVDVRKQLELLEVRRPLEVLMAVTACTRSSTDERAVMTKLANELKRAADAVDVHEYFRVNREIHDIEVAAAHNSMLSTTMQIIQAQSRWFWYLNVKQTGTFAEGAERHGCVLKAIAKGDVEAAAQAAEDLIQFLDRLTRSTIDTFSVS
jgi:DNA-binding GntR family transcriptional regulator